MSYDPFPAHLIEGNRWILANGSFSLIESVIAQEKKEANVDGTHLIGYLYVDSTAGLSLHLETLAIVEPDGLIKRTGGGMDRNVGIRIRYNDDAFRGFQLLTNEEIKYLKLGVEPKGFQIYRRPELEPLRKISYLHPLRAPGFPDDIQVLLLPSDKNQRPEEVWARLRQQVNETTFECALLNQPYQNLGINMNDVFIVHLGQVQGRIVAFSEGKSNFR